MDKKDRRLIQLQIEREAVKREKDEASQKRLELINEEITALQKEIADLDELWKSEKAQAQGSKTIMQEVEKVRQQIKELTDKGDFNHAGELQYGKLPELEKRLKDAQAQEADKTKDAKGGGRTQLLRTMVGADEIAEVVSRATGIPVSKMLQGERDKLLQMEDQAARPRGRAGRSHCGRGQRHSPLTFGLERPQSPHRLFLVPGPHGRGQDRAVQSAGGLPV